MKLARCFFLRVHVMFVSPWAISLSSHSFSAIFGFNMPRPSCFYSRLVPRRNFLKRFITSNVLRYSKTTQKKKHQTRDPKSGIFLRATRVKRKYLDVWERFIALLSPLTYLSTPDQRRIIVFFVVFIGDFWVITFTHAFGIFIYIICMIVNA